MPKLMIEDAPFGKYFSANSKYLSPSSFGYLTQVTFLWFCKYLANSKELSTLEHLNKFKSSR